MKNKGSLHRNKWGRVTTARPVLKVRMEERSPRWRLAANTGLFEMIVGVLTTCHTQYTSDSSVCVFLFSTTTL